MALVENNSSTSHAINMSIFENLIKLNKLNASENQANAFDDSSKIAGEIELTTQKANNFPRVGSMYPCFLIKKWENYDLTNLQ